MKKICTILSAIIITCMLVSCGGNSIVGIWEPNDSGYQMEFFEDGTILSEYGTGQYKISDDELRILNMGFMGQIISYEFEVKGDTLTLTNEKGDSNKYTRKK